MKENRPSDSEKPISFNIKEIALFSRKDAATSYFKTLFGSKWFIRIKRGILSNRHTFVSVFLKSFRRHPAGSVRTPEEETSVEITRLICYIATLPEKKQEILLLYCSGVSAEEIGAIADVAIEEVKLTIQDFHCFT